MKDMLGRAVRLLVDVPARMLGSICDLLEKVSGKEGGEEWLAELKKFLLRKPCWTGEVVKTILEFVGNVTVTLTAGEFIAKDNFVLNTGKNARVKISYLGDNLKKYFLDKIENFIGDGDVSLVYNKLKESSRDIPIISELGGEDQAETMLGVIFSLMSKQPNGEDGVLLSNGYANIFYVRDDVQVLWAVGVGWGGDGWRVNAYSVAGTNGWDGAYRVFSRNSSNA
ncbi:MAG: hypothetical protein HGB08_04310 [Candidatus Moranbacteria bacterium]|nr:hypothetical protein [Candidatus Moranbacteria bacterium]